MTFNVQQISVTVVGEAAHSVFVYSLQLVFASNVFVFNGLCADRCYHSPLEAVVTTSNTAHETLRVISPLLQISDFTPKSTLYIILHTLTIGLISP